MTVALPAESDYPFWCEEKLRNADTDQQGHINNAVMATFFEAGRMEVFAHPVLDRVRASSLFVIARVVIDYKRELFYPGVVRVGSRVSEIGRTSFKFEQTLRSGEHEVARAEATCVLLDLGTRKPTPVPEDVRAVLVTPSTAR
jgi:acyl-CoA thioester hydrolase